MQAVPGRMVTAGRQGTLCSIEHTSGSLSHPAPSGKRIWGRMASNITVPLLSKQASAHLCSAGAGLMSRSAGDV